MQINSIVLTSVQFWHILLSAVIDSDHFSNNIDIVRIFYDCLIVRRAWLKDELTISAKDLFEGSRIVGTIDNAVYLSVFKVKALCQKSDITIIDMCIRHGVSMYVKTVIGFDTGIHKKVTRVVLLGEYAITCADSSEYRYSTGSRNRDVRRKLSAFWFPSHKIHWCYT